MRENAMLSHRRFLRFRLGPLGNAKQPPGITSENLFLVLLGQTEFFYNFYGYVRLPARIVVAEHDVIDAEELDCELQTGCVRRNSIGEKSIKILVLIFYEF